MDTLNIIISLLNAKGKRQNELTDYLGLSKNAFTNWKNGNNTSYMKHLPQIAEFFGVSIDYLLGKQQHENDEALEFTYALYNEMTHGLSEEQIDQLKKFAEFLRNS